MLTIHVPDSTDELWDEKNEEFKYLKFSGRVLRLEHSLISIAKWETKYCRAFIGSKVFTDDEFLYYIKCMTIDKNVDDSVYMHLTFDNKKSIKEYINAPLTATHVVQYAKAKTKMKESITSELIYYWMIVFGIPFECEKWPLQRLLALLDICQAKTKSTSKKHGKIDAKQMADRQVLNAKRKAQLHTTG